MTRTKPRHELTESATALLNATVFDYESVTRLRDHSSRGRISQMRTTLGTHDGQDLTAQNAFFRLVAICEAFTDKLAMNLLREQLRDPAPSVEQLVSRHEQSDFMNWPGRAKVFSEIHHVNFRNCPSWTELNTAIDVRNALAHGLGTLTPKQRATNKDWRQHLGRIQIQLRGHDLVIRRPAVHKCHSYASKFVSWLDLQI